MTIPFGYTSIESVQASDTKTAKLSTSQLLASTGFPCLRRHRLTGEYYGLKKVAGKGIKQFKLHSQAGMPISERKMAERFLRVWLDSLNAPAPEKIATLTFSELLEKHRAAKGILARKSRNNVEWTINTLNRTWTIGLNVPVSEVKTSDLAAWFAKLNGLKASSFNEISRQIKNIFALAVNDGIIAKSPYDGVPTKRKKVNRNPLNIPSLKQFGEIVAAIRHQRFADHNEDSADLAAFLGLAALGEAEAQRLKWGNVDFEKGWLAVRRQKTGKHFDVPIYDHLKPLLLAMYERQGKPGKAETVFKVASCKRTLDTVCRNLGYSHFSPRTLRSMGIVRLLRAGINVKLVAKWQGHQDGGKLILDTYSEVISESDRDFERSELQKLKA